MPNAPVDGWVEETNTIYEFLGDIFHGHPQLWPAKKNYYGKDYKELFTKTVVKLKNLRAAGYRVCYIWECEMMKWKKTHGPGNLSSITRTFDTTLEYTLDEQPTTPVDDDSDDDPIDLKSIMASLKRKAVTISVDDDSDSDDES